MVDNADIRRFGHGLSRLEALPARNGPLVPAKIFECQRPAESPREIRHGATAMVTWFVVVTPPIWICRDTASPVGVLGAGVTPI
jgi:hypothetical protein